MPNMKSAMKALRQTKKRTERNMKVKENIAYLKRSLRKSVEAKDVKTAEGLIAQIIKAVDKASQNKVVKKNAASRIKSRLTKRVNAIKK